MLDALRSGNSKARNAARRVIVSCRLRMTNLLGANGIYRQQDRAFAALHKFIAAPHKLASSLSPQSGHRRKIDSGTGRGTVDSTFCRYFRNFMRLAPVVWVESGEKTMELKQQDAIALLKQDHRAVEELFSQFEKASGDNRKQKIANEICLELSVHAKIEEEIFYPACEGKVEEDLLKEAYVEHDGAKMLIAEIMGGGPDEEFYDAKVTVLQEQIEHHVEEEEKRMEGLFAQARKAGLDMDALGVELANRKQELKAEYERDGLPMPQLTTVH